MEKCARNFSTEKYAEILQELRERLLSADALSGERNVVFVESTSLQIRKVLELIAYLSVMVNVDKLSLTDKKEYNASAIVRTLSRKTTIFYPIPSYMVHPRSDSEQPVMVPRGFKHALSQESFVEAYNFCGRVLHAQHPLKKELKIEEVWEKNRKTLSGLRELLASYTVAIKKAENHYTFLHVEIDFSNSDLTRLPVIREYNTKIHDEGQMLALLQGTLSRS